VCVVDDDVAVCAALALLVESGGYSTRCFTSGEAFVEASRTSPADCAVVDVTMPGLDGPGVLGELRHEGNQVPVIFITAHDQPARHRQLVADGGRVVLLKPVDPVTLLRQAFRPRASTALASHRSFARLAYTAGCGAGGHRSSALRVSPGTR